MKKLLVILFISFIIGCSTKESQIEKLDGSHISKSKLTAKIQSLVDSASVTGISIAIFNDNKIAYQKSFGYANLKEKDSLSNKTVFYGASLVQPGRMFVS